MPWPEAITGKGAGPRDTYTPGLQEVYVLCVACFLLTVIFNCLCLTVISRIRTNTERPNLSEFLFFFGLFMVWTLDVASCPLSLLLSAIQPHSTSSSPCLSPTERFALEKFAHAQQFLVSPFTLFLIFISLLSPYSNLNFLLVLLWGWK